MAYKLYPNTVVVTKGTRVRTNGQLVVRKSESVATIRRTEPARDGKTRVFWKSNGRIVSALVR